MDKEKRKRLFWIIFTITINIAIVLFILIREISKSKDNIQPINFATIRYEFIAISIGLFIIALLAEFLKSRRMIMITEGKVDNIGALNSTIICKYYDNITPFGAGGQAFQINYLHKRGHSSGTSSSVPVASFFTTQVAFVILAIVILIINGKLLDDQPVIKISAIVGLAMYSLIPLLVILFSIIPKTLKKIIGAFISLLAKIHLVKDKENTKNKIFTLLDNYRNDLKTMCKRPILFIKIMVLSIIYQAAIMSIPFFVLLSFGGKNDYFTIFSMTIFIYLSITIIPTPGNEGAAEGSFYIVFSALEGGYLFWAMILWRLFVYYSWIIIGLFVVTKSAINNKLPQKRKVDPNKPLKIAFFIDTFYPIIDGVVNTVNAYAKEIIKDGGYVCIFCPKYNNKYKDEHEYDVIRTPSIRINKFKFSVALPFASKNVKKKFKEVDFDIVHSHSPFGTGKIAIKMAKKYNIPHVSSFHSKYYDDAKNITHSRILAKIFVDLIVSFYCHCDYVWACSGKTRETLIKYGYNGNIDVMENGVYPLPDDSKEDLIKLANETISIPHDKKIILFVGQMIWQKNLRLVLNTAKVLKERGQNNFHFLIVGTGYNEKDIKRYATKLGIDDMVTFTGKIIGKKIITGIYYSSDLFFFPSYYDNAPLVLREASLASLPSLLVTDMTAAEVIEDNVNGYLQDNNPMMMADKIIDIFKDENKDKYQQVAIKAKETIPIFWSEIALRVLNKYRNLDGK